MASLSAARRRLRLGSRRALLASAALCSFSALAGCGTTSGSTNTSNPNQTTGGTGASVGGTAGTVASGGSTPGTAGATASGGGGGTINGTGGSGGAAAQGGSMGSAGAAGAATLTVGNAGGKYSLSFGQTYIEIDPANGARITALRVGGATGTDVILNQTVNAGTANSDNWGSTFWPSPQTWPWPPTGTASIGAINTSPYTAAMDASSVTLTSGIATAPTVSVVKKFSADLAKEAIVIDYTVTNGGAAAVSVAPWEITRMGAGSITFYPPGTGAPKAGGSFALPPTTTMGGATWFQHTGSATNYKLLADGSEGWIASAVGDLILVKSFTNIDATAAAPGEAEIEIYSSQLYVEVEQQGALQMLAPGAALHWTVRWYVRKMATPAAVGSMDLVTYVQNLIK